MPRLAKNQISNYKSWEDLPVVMPLSIVAELFQVDVRAVYKWIKNKEVYGIQLGKKWYFEKAEIQKLFKKHS